MATKTKPSKSSRFVLDDPKAIEIVSKPKKPTKVAKGSKK